MSSEERSRQPSTVSAFDLEPNPFEQSFASSKKALSLSGAAPHPSQPKNPLRNNSISTLTQNSQRSTSHSLNSIPEEHGNPTIADNANHNEVKRDSPNFIPNQQRPNIISPPILTPGGSKKLPPLLLSPSILYQANATSNANSNSLSASTSTSNPSALAVSSTSGSLYLNGSPPSGSSLIRQPRNPNSTSSTTNGLSTNDSQMPGFLLNLSKSGLTPNESNIRSGLTPGILTQSYNYPVLPSINKNAVSNGKNPNKSIPANGTTENHAHVNIMHPTVNGTPLTPGLSSLLNLPSAGVLTNPIYKPTQSTNVTDVTINNNTGNNSISPNTPSKAAVHNPEGLNSIEQPADNHNENERLTTQLEDSDLLNSKTRKRKRRMSSTSSVSKAPRKYSSSRKSSTVTPTPVPKDDVDNNKNSNNEIIEETEEQEKKRKEFLERNRVAASKFRKRKKEYIKKIENDLQFYETEYDDLSQAVGKLCGIPSNSSNSQFNVSLSTPSSSSSPPSTSLLSLLETSISRNDNSSAMSILSSMKQTIYETNFYRRGGKNPRDDMEDQEDQNCFTKDINLVKNENPGYPSINSRPIILDKKFPLNSVPSISKGDSTTNNVGNNTQSIINSCYTVPNPLVINANPDSHDVNNHDVLSTLPRDN
ncbi:sko1p [Saccharomyces arboricola H-6]|uniref:Sko1p n=1 Tax=Saccharomyces arboricola (strain H-6 / AS 2.3317 / CBS 10644) TaxID=1160507 RepID=J8PIP9_SACAR|nr:sko1p [Saccharomyces arboricola H-6]